jgi:acetyl-CoA acyltransferase 2
MIFETNHGRGVLCRQWLRPRRFGTRYGVDLKLEDSLAAALVDQNPGGQKTAMGGEPIFIFAGLDMLTSAVTAENLAKKYGITRDECDGMSTSPFVDAHLAYPAAFALMTQQRYNAALSSGAFTSELIPIPLKPKKGVPQLLEADEHPRPQSTLASLSSLPSVFQKDGVVTAGNASGICDGAAANVVMSESSLQKYGVKPLARIAAYAWSACEPEIMGIGPVVSVKEALRKAGKRVDDMDIIEVNEVCSSVYRIRQTR